MRSSLGAIVARRNMLFGKQRVSNRGIQFEVLVLVGHVELPAEPGDRVPLPHQEAIAKFLRGVGRDAPVDQPENAVAAAVGDLKEHAAIAALHILGLQKIKVRRKLDLAGRVTLGLVQVYDLPVVEGGWVYLEVNTTGNPLVGANSAERLAILNVSARQNLHAVHPRCRRRSELLDHSQDTCCVTEPRKHPSPPALIRLTQPQ